MNRSALWILLVPALLLSACQGNPKEASSDSAQANRPQSAQAQRGTPSATPTVTSTPPQTPKKTTKTLGVTVDDGKIIIDTRQTKRFLHGIREKMKKSFDKIEAALRKEKIDSLDETGIIITDTKMRVDLNKTRNFMEKWIRSMESVMKELNKTIGEIKRGLPRR